MTEPEAKPAVSRKTKRLIWGTAILLAALLLGVTGAWVLSSWYVQKNNDRWCQFYAVVTRPLPNGGDALLIAELDRLRVETGCG